MRAPFVAVLLGLPRLSVGGLLLAAAFAQFVAAKTVGALRVDHLPLPGVLLMAVGSWLALSSTDTPVWRVLPIVPQQLALARWSIIGLAGGLSMSVALVLAALDNHSLGYSMPTLGPQLLALWSALGYAVWLPARPARRSLRSVTGAFGVGLVLLLVLLGLYGYPWIAGLRVPSIVVMGLGCLLFIAAPLRILRGSQAGADADREPWRHSVPRRHSVDAGPVVGGQGAGVGRRSVGRDRSSGWGVLIRPLLLQTVLMSLVCIGAICGLRRLYPEATELLIWVFLCGIAVWSSLVTRRWTRSLWIWRCLPASSRQLALQLQALTALPAAVTLVVALAINHLAPETSMPLPGWLIAAFIALQSIIETQFRAHVPRRAEGLNAPGWLVDTVWLTYPGYIGAVLLTFLLHFAPLGFSWLQNLMAPLAAVLLVSAYAMTLAQLRSGSTSAQQRGDSPPVRAFL